jgi:hypothetical protein
VSGSLRLFRVGVVLYAALVALAWVFGLWLFVLGLASAGAVVVRHRILTLRQLPARVAAWALHAPRGLSPPVALEQAIAVDLAAVSQGQLDCLDRAQGVVAESVDDPWRRELAAERLARAHDLIAGGDIVGVTAREETPRVRLRDSAGVVMLIVLLALGNLTQSRWWLIPLGVVSVLLAVEFVDLYERRRALPELLASRSVQDPIQGPFVMFEHDVARSLVVLARHDRLVIERARCLVEATSSEQDYARQRLMEADRLLLGTAARRSRSGLSTWLLRVVAPAAAASTFPWWPMP